MVFAFVKLLAVALATSDANLLTKPATLEKEIRLEKALGALIGRRLQDDENGANGNGVGNGNGGETGAQGAGGVGEKKNWGLEDFGKAWESVKLLYDEIAARISGCADECPNRQKVDLGSFFTHLGAILKSCAFGIWDIAKTLFNVIVGLFKS